MGRFPLPGIRGENFFDFFPEPAVGGIVLDALMPVQVRFKARRREWERIYLIDQNLVQQMGVPLGQGEQHVGLTDHHAGGEVVLAAKKNLAPQSAPAEFDIDQAGTVAAGRDLNMTLRHVGIQIKQLLDGRMTTPRQDYERFIQKLLMPNAIAGRHGNVDGQVDRAAG